MKKISVIAAMLVAVCIGFSGCSNSAADGNTPTEPTVPSTQQSDLYGSYWGVLNFAGTHDLCVVIEADKVVLHSNFMGFPYPLVTYKDGGDGTWTVNCYHADGDTSQEPRTRVVIDTKTSPFTSKATIIPMKATTGVCTKGQDYNNEYAH